MARSISQIYAEAIHTRNNYLQITELNSGRTGSKMSILNLITYVMAALIQTYETTLDLFQADIASVINSRINGTAPYYALVAKLFQFNPEQQVGDRLIFNENTYKIEYETVNEAHRIIAQSSYEDYGNDGAIVLKVCKNSDDANDIDNGTLYTQLTDAELTAFKNYISTIKYCGAKIYCVSNPGDIVLIHTSQTAPIYYDDALVTRTQAIQNIKKAIAEYTSTFEYDTYISYQKIIDTIQNAEGITDISSNVKIGVKKYDSKTGVYGAEKKITGRIRSGSGFIKFLDTDGASTIDDLALVSETSRKESTSQVSVVNNQNSQHLEWVQVDGGWVAPTIPDLNYMDTYTERKR